jgi:hypothetical protein
VCGIYKKVATVVSVRPPRTSPKVSSPYLASVPYKDFALIPRRRFNRLPGAALVPGGGGLLNGFLLQTNPFGLNDWPFDVTAPANSISTSVLFYIA